MAPANATIVFGNLGPDNSGDIDTSGYTISSTNQFAQSFTTGSSFLYLQSVFLGMGKTTGPDTSATVSIWSNSGSLPGGILATSEPITISLSGPVLSTFALPYQLTASTTYWITVNDASPGDSSPIWFSGVETLPGEQNGSGYDYLSGAAVNTGSGWSAAPYANLLSVSLSADSAAPAVPEPGTWAAAALLTGGAAFVRWRKREKAS